MTTVPEAASPASTAPKGNDGDGKTNTAANVSAAEAIRRFAQADARRQSSAPPASDTSANGTAKPAPSEGSNAVSSSEAEPAQPAEPQAESNDVTEAQAPQAEAEETKSEEAEGDVLSPESSLDQKTKERIQKRIDREVGKRKAQEARTQALEQELQQLKSQVGQLQQPEAPTAQPSPAAKAPLPDIKDAQALAEYKSVAKQTVRWAEEMLDRDDIDNGVTAGDKTYTKAEVKAIMRNARVALEDTIPAQQEYLQQQVQRQQLAQQITQQAHSKFPFMADQNSEEVKASFQFFRTHAPEVLESPAAKWIIGAYVNGIKAVVAAEEAAKAKPKAEAKEAPKEAPKPPAPKPKAPGDQSAVSTSGTVPRMSPDAMSKGAIQAEYERFKTRGNATGNAAAEMLAKLDRARRGGA